MINRIKKLLLATDNMICSECESEMIVEKDYINIDSYNQIYIICPMCGASLWLN